MEEQSLKISSPPHPEHHSRVLIYGIAAMLLIIISLGVGFYMGLSNRSGQIKFIDGPMLILSPTLEPTSSALPRGWTKKLDPICNVELPLPPKEAPYYVPDDPNTSPDLVDDDGHFWMFDSYPNTDPNEKLFTHVSFVSYSNPRAGGSGYVAGVVDILCGTNTNKYSTQTLLDAYSKKFTDGTFSGITLEKKEIVTMWQRPIAVLYISGGMYDETKPHYLFATDDHVYYVSKTSMSSNNFTKETTEKIFQNLIFKD